MIPISGSIFGICMPISTPAAAARAEPRAKVMAMMRSVEMPMSLAASRLKDTARIALPVAVFRMKKRRRIMRRNETAMTVSCSLVSRTPPTMKSALRSEGREELRVGAEDELAAVLEKQRDADRGDEERQPRGAPDRPVGEALDDDAEHGAASIAPSMTSRAPTSDGSSPLSRRER